jgi:cardiolipin synthase (CMP-forming)
MDGIPEWLAVVVVSRDILILIGYGIIHLLVPERPPVKPSVIGKCSTLLQLLTLGVSLALLHNENFLDHRLWNLLIAATAIATVISGLQYLYRGLVWLQNRVPKITGLG